jgi:membrane protein DedA with SNARE-associated domain
MLALIEDQLTSFLTHFTYLALVLVLTLAGLGLPIPEDIPLIFSGYLCSHQYSPIIELQREADTQPAMIDTNKDGIPDKLNPRRKHYKVPKLHLMMLAGMIGVLLGDSIVFSIGRRGIESNNFVARHLRKHLHSKRRERVERHFARHGNLTVFVGRFAPGFRSIVFAFAGMSKMSYARFLMIDGIAALISVPTFIWIGHHFADRFKIVENFLHRTRHIIGPVFIVLVIGLIVLYYVRRRRRLALGIPAEESSSPTTASSTTSTGL